LCDNDDDDDDDNKPPVYYWPTWAVGAHLRAVRRIHINNEDVETSFLTYPPVFEESGYSG
jgi:hypothetical protein